MNKIINHDQLLKQFFIVNTFDNPCERHVAQLRAGQLFYIAPELSRYGGMSEMFSTPLEDFGFQLSVENGVLECIQVAPSNAHYEDGRKRKWQGSARFSIKLGDRAMEGALALAADKMLHAKCEAKEIASELERVKHELEEAREDADHWKIEYEIVVARLCGKRHQRDNSIVADDEVIPKLIRALEWIAERYDDSKPMHQVAMDAYQMSCTARAVLQKEETK